MLKTQVSLVPSVVFLLCLMAGSCVEEIDLDTGEEILCAYCILNQGPGQSLDLSYISTVNRKGAPVDDAQVELFDGKEKIGEFKGQGNGKWTIDHSPAFGHTYRLVVRVPGQQVLEAKTTFPEMIAFKEANGWKKAPHEMIPIGFSGLVADSAVDQILWCYFETEGPDAHFVDYIATDHPCVDQFGITSHYFDPDHPRTSSWILYTPNLGWRLGGVFSSDPVFLYEKALRITHPSGFLRPYDTEIVHFSPELETGGKTSIFLITGVSYEPTNASLVICVVSDDYDQYLRDCYREMKRQEDYDFASRIYKANHYSNIRGGIGLFGAQYEFRKEVRFDEWI